jgi:hypothetical protein
MIRAVEGQVPWINGNTFKQIISKNPANIKGAFNEQMKQNRSALLGQLREIGAARNCLNHSSKLSCPGANGILGKLPTFSWKSDGSGALDYVANADCRFTNRSVNQQWDDFGRNMFNMTAPTVATWGLGTMAASARTAMAAGETASQGSKLAFMGAGALDAANVGVAFKHTADACLSDGKLTEVTSTGGISVEKGPSCAIDKNRQNAINDSQSCLMAAATEGVPSLLPFVPLAAKASRLRSIVKAEKAVDYAAFESRFTQAGGKMDDFVYAMSEASPQTQARMGALMQKLSGSREKMSAFAKRLKDKLSSAECKFGP